MSVLDIVIRDAEALIAIDTAFCNHATGQRLHGAKCLALSHMRAVVAGRGDLGLLLDVFAHLAGQTRDVDDAIGQLRFAVRCSSLTIAALYARMRLDPVASEIAIVGWSAQSSEVIGARIGVDATGAVSDVVHMRGGTTWAAPWAPDEPEFAGREHPTDAVQMLEAVPLQVAFHRRVSGPNGACGGRLTIVRVTQATITFTDCGDISPLHNAGASPWVAISHATAAGSLIG